MLKSYFLKMYCALNDDWAWQYKMSAAKHTYPLRVIYTSFQVFIQIMKYIYYNVFPLKLKICFIGHASVSKMAAITIDVENN